MVDPRSDALKVGTSDETGLLNASFNVIVTVEVAVPSAVTGPVPVMDELAASTAPALKTTVPSVLATGVTIARVFVSAFVEVKEQIEIPDAFVAEQAVMALVVPVSVAEKVGVMPATGLLPASLSVITIVEVEAPSAVTGPVPVMVEFAATADPGVNTTVPPAFTTGVAIERVFVSALAEARVQVETPEASVAEQVP